MFDGEKIIMRKTTIKTPLIIFVLLIILAIWLSPFILIGAFIYLGYAIRKAILKKKIRQRIKNGWFPMGKYALFLYSGSKKWQRYFEQDLIPKIQSKAIIWNWSTRYAYGWKDDLLEARILKFFRPSGRFHPMAIVFLPSGTIKTFQFYVPYVKMLKSQNQNQDYKNSEKDFLNLLDSL